MDYYFVYIVSTSQNSSFNLDEIPKPLFQIHLERIADYLVPGEGVWWHYNSQINNVIFHDSSSSKEVYNEGPELLDFDDYTMVNVTELLYERWQTCIQRKVKLPLNSLILYDREGEFLEKVEGIRPKQNELIEDEKEDYCMSLIPEETESDINVLGEIVETSDNNPTKQILTVKVQSQETKNFENKSESVDACPTVKKSKMVSLIEKVVGSSELLSKFEKNHLLYKSNPTTSKAAGKQCAEILPTIQAQVLKEHCKSKTNYEAWEVEFFEKNGVAPCEKDVIKSKEVKLMFEKIKISKKLLQLWKINLNV